MRHSHYSLVHVYLVSSFQIIAALAAVVQVVDLVHCIKVCVFDGAEVYGADVSGPAINLIAVVSTDHMFIYICVCVCVCVCVFIVLSSSFV